MRIFIVCLSLVTEFGPHLVSVREWPGVKRRDGGFRRTQIPKDAMLLRIFIGENDRHHDKPLYETIVTTAREIQMAGATMLLGPMSFGRSSRLHSARIQRLSEDLLNHYEAQIDSPITDRFR